MCRGRLNDKGDPDLSMDDLLMLIQNPRNMEKENPQPAWLPDPCWGSVQVSPTLVLPCWGSG